MMNKYILSSKYSSNFSVQHYAGTKAPLDVETILMNDGFKRLFFPQKQIQIIQQISDFIHILYFLCLIPAKSLLLVQYPSYPPLCKVLLPIFKIKAIKLVALIHDMDSLRYDGAISSDEASRLKHYDYIIAHTPAMEKMLLSKGIKSKIYLLESFDYLVKKENTVKRLYSKDVCFAGNLRKSEFIPKLLTCNIGDIRFRLYGNSPSYKLVDKFHYEGFFSSDDVSNIEGSWGLIWDGTSIDSLEGSFGKYLKYIAPHKFSLYMDCNMPVVVSSDSAMAQLVREKNLGVCVESLRDLPKVIGKITPDEYNTMQLNVCVYSKSIRSGEHLRGIIESLCS